MDIPIHIKNLSNNPHPLYQTALSAGVDVCAFTSEKLILMPQQRMLVGTGLYIALPSGFEAQIRPRSGLALKHGITVLNSPGTIDADYRGEIKILLINHGSEAFEIKNGDRIAQMIICSHSKVAWIETNDLNETERGAGGYGSTGI
jgi:dUTP pyrophosphatase